MTATQELTKQPSPAKLVDGGEDSDKGSNCSNDAIDA